MSFLSGPSRRQDGAGTRPTYRHILNPQAMTVSNPLRCIAHCDIDAAYAQFEQVRLGIPDTEPLICAQWQSIIAVNYPARKFGIKRFNTIDEAKKMCPHLLVQHVATYRNGEAEAGYWGEVDPRTHKVSLDPYRRESLKILAIFKEMIPRGEIEKASIDEAFLDLSQMVIERMLERFPHLGRVPDDAPDGIDSLLPAAPTVEWGKAGNVFPGEAGLVPAAKTNAEEGETADEVDEGEDRDEEDSHGQEGGSWEDWALCIGGEIMAEVRGEVWKALHYTCSAGIAHNKAMAKLCSAWKKPNNQTILRSSASAAFLRDMDFTDIRYLGGKLGNAIANEYGAKTVGDMLTVPLEEMQKRFGEESIWVYNILRGIDHTEVTARVATKSMLASKNVRPSVTTPEQGIHWLNVLAGELHVRLRDAREISPGLWPKSLVLSHRTGIDPSRSRQTPFPFTRSLSTEYILRYAKKLWEEVTQPMNKGNMKLNNIALAFSGLERLEEGQRGIENFFGANAPPPSKPIIPAAIVPSSKRSRSPSPNSASTPLTTSALTSISTSISPKKPRLPTLHTGGKRKTALDSFLSKNGESSKFLSTPPEAPVARHEVIDVSAEGEDDPMEDSSSSWTCPKCGIVFSALGNTSASKVQLQKQEHEDYHFAMDLQGDGPGATSSTSRRDQAPLAKVKKKAKKPEGIKAFFTKSAKPEPP